MTAKRADPAQVLRPMPPRNPGEAHRAATPLELLFDLVFVIAIASAAAGLHHAIAEAHALDGLLRFCLAFFAIWWAWMNYTWFASAYDNGDAAFRILTMVIMAGALTMAAGIDAMFSDLDISLPVLGYVVMRVAMALLWLRAARNHPERRQTALVYGSGIATVQLYWIAFALIHPTSAPVFYAMFLLGGILELAIPVIAERNGTTTWHRHHIIERYGLLNIIVLGETLLAAAIALQAASGEHFDMGLLWLAVSALVIVFGMWWLYFAPEDHLESSELKRALIWGYGHAVIFASGAAVGAGIAVLVDVITHHAEISFATGARAVAIPLALYLVALWAVRDRYCLSGPGQYTLPAFAVLIFASTLTPFALEAMAGLVVLCVLARSVVPRQNEATIADADV